MLGGVLMTNIAINLLQIDGYIIMLRNLSKIWRLSGLD